MHRLDRQACLRRQSPLVSSRDIRPQVWKHRTRSRAINHFHPATLCPSDSSVRYSRAVCSLCMYCTCEDITQRRQIHTDSMPSESSVPSSGANWKRGGSKPVRSAMCRISISPVITSFLSVSVSLREWWKSAKPETSSVMSGPRCTVYSAYTRHQVHGGPDIMNEERALGPVLRFAHSISEGVGALWVPVRDRILLGETKLRSSSLQRCRTHRAGASARWPAEVRRLIPLSGRQ